MHKGHIFSLWWKALSPIFLSSLFWKVKRRGQKVTTRNNISIYLSKIATLKNLSQLLLCWLVCRSKDLSCLLLPSSFMLSTSNTSNISPDVEFVICTYNFLHFLLGSTHCSQSAKVKDKQPSSFHYFLYCYCSLWLLSPVWIILTLDGFLIVFCLCASNLITFFVFIATVSCWDSWKYVLDPIKDDIFQRYFSIIRSQFCLEKGYLLREP